MKRNRFGVAFGSFVLTTTLLYFIGHMFTIPLLMWQFEYTDHANGFYVKSGSMLPFIYGLIISFIAEKIYFYKHQQKLG
ncbi:hypothetical protein [Bacillus sp. FJAT-29814]|uniref:hypothetical protein n=1 Tax=Bacillus sp. FJAT-29814 TaxID=1729688 RepID=UPI000836ED6F|nr:hypothetical protein [Bacillus sp. FJAT-29814]